MPMMPLVADGDDADCVDVAVGHALDAVRGG